MNDDIDLGIFEAGISMPGEMQSLQRMIKPTIGILTNVGSEHAEGFESMLEKCREKAGLFVDCDRLIYCDDDPLVKKVMDEEFGDKERCAWSFKDSVCRLYVKHVEKSDGSTVIEYVYDSRSNSVTIPFTADSDVENAIHCIAVMSLLGVSDEVIAERMSRLTPVGTRLNVMEGVNNCMLICDAYTSDYHSLNPALDFMGRRMTADRTSTVILSDVMHEDMDSDALYRSIAELLQNRHIDRVIGIGHEISRHASCFGGDAKFYRSTDEFLGETTTSDFDHEPCADKGSG